ncbi:beta-galactosidase [Streptomyces sp. C1-1]|uniref:beta-galactosidase n=1 Tax=Streptomyces sp. C1-1 TaxID=3231173 RepID=UPI003D0535B8
MTRPLHLRVPAPSAPPLTGHLPFADAPGVPDPIEVTSRWLTRGGRPWFPVSGEFHYSRHPAAAWSQELLKMKAAGVTVVASYVIWIHHQETEGRVRFDGDRDLRRFAELCARHGLDFVPRIGPWSHAEVRNGGLPDWLLARDCAPRTDDPAYLEPVRTWFAAVAEQLRGLDRAHGGPIVAIQIENELYDRPGHLLTLKRMAQEAGLSAPLWSSTAWGGVRLPPDELLPLYGGYTEAFWTLAATDGIAPELAFDGGTLASVATPSAEVSRVGGRVLVSGLRPGTDALVEVETADGGRVGLLVLDAATARTLYRGVAWGAERLVLCADGVVFDRDEVRVHGRGERSSFAVLPDPGGELAGAVREGVDGVFTRWSVEAGDAVEVPEVSVALLRAAGAAPAPVTGVLGRASAPADKYFETVAAVYRVEVPEDLPAGALLRVRWTGDVARAYVGDVLVADQFFSGRVWDIAVGRLPRGPLRLCVLPLAADAAVSLPEGERERAGTAAVLGAEWVVVRGWAVR